MIPLRAYLIPLAVLLLIIAIGKARAEEARPPVVITVGLTCPDVQALAGWKGWDEIERRARAAGASEQQIRQAKRCLH